MAIVTTPPGRPPAPEPPEPKKRKAKRIKSEQVQIWAAPKEEGAWKAAAKRNNLSLSEWMRRQANTAANIKDLKNDRSDLVLARQLLNAVIAEVEKRGDDVPAELAATIVGRINNAYYAVNAVLNRMMARR